MIKNNKGITLIALIITVIVLGILTSVSINVGYGTYKSMVVNSYVTKMNMIQARVNLIKSMIENGDTSYNNIGTEISALSQDLQDEIDDILFEKSAEDFKYYTANDLVTLGIDKLDLDCIINLETCEIYSIQGIEYNGEMHHNQYYLPNGIKIYEYNQMVTNSTDFSIEVNNYGLNAKISVVDIIYDSQINSSKSYLGLVTNESTNPATVDFWREMPSNSYSVTKSGKYAVKLVDSNNNETIKLVTVVTCNAPEITEGMVPVIYDDNTWKVVDETNIGNWYDYAQGKWANVMLKDGLVIEDDGSISSFGSMFVWIPRYAYKITSSYHNGGEGVHGNIDIKFMQGTYPIATDELTTIISDVSGTDNWNIPTAFRNNVQNGGWDRELTGFWVAKFEASSSNQSSYGDNNNSNVKVLPNVYAWNNISVLNAMKNCLSMNADNNIYELSKNAKTHLMKNSEFGAVAYLTHSKFGRNGVNISRNISSGLTGNATDSEDYLSQNGLNTSSTGNIYGVYDLNGGKNEYVSSMLTSYITSNIQSLAGFNEKYVERYEMAQSENSGIGNYLLRNAKYGDAIYETSINGSYIGAWYPTSSTSQSTFVYSGSDVLTRGQGLFEFASANGSALSGTSFRPVIVIE